MSIPASLPLLVVFGAGGHGRVAADAALASRRWSTVLASDRRPELWGSELLPGVTIVDPDRLADLPGRLQLHVAIGDNGARQRESELLLQSLAGLELASIVHPLAAVSPHARIGAGSLLAAHCVVAPMTTIGTGVIVNHGAVVDHDCRVGDWTHLGPGSRLGGAASVGSHCLIGSGSCLLARVQLGDHCVLGAGGVALHPIAAGQRWAGVPARPLAQD